MAKKHEKMRVDTPEGEIDVDSEVVESAPPTIKAVDGEELMWLRSLGNDGPRFVTYYLPHVTEPDLKDYDAAFRAWQRDEASPYTKQQVIQLIGGYLGNKCVADLDMEWVTVTDEHGTDYAVYKAATGVMCFPFSAVFKRIEDNEYDFIQSLYYVTKAMIVKGE